MKRFLKGVGLILIAASVSACAAPAVQDNMVPPGINAVSSSNALANRISDSTVTGGQETSPLWTSEISSGDFEAALEKSLQQAGFLSANGNLMLAAQLLEVNQPLIGLNLKVETVIRYTLTNSTGRTVYDKTIRASHIATFEDAAIAVTRLRLANEGSAQANLALLLQDLNALGMKSSISALTS